MRIVTTLAAALIGIGAATAASAQGKTVKIATEGAYAPYNFTAPGGKLDGFEIELAAELCKRAKITCEVVQQDWDGIIPALQAGKYDAIMAGMNITEKRAAVIDFSSPYVQEAGSFGVAKDNPLAKLPGDGATFNFDKDNAAAVKALEAMKPMLKGKTVGVQVSTIHASFVDKYLKGTVDIREYKTTEQHDLDLLSGRIDAIFASASAIRGTFEKPDFKDYTLAGARFSGDVFGRGVAVGMRKGETDLKAKFDEAIASMNADGSLKALSLKWFKSDITIKS
jgi:octopine/nopaline transport system substrate-binding protein